MRDNNYDDIDYDAIRRRVNRRMLLWGSIAVHGVLWVVGSGISAILWDDKGVVPVVWLGIVGLHAVIIGLLTARDSMLQHEIERERDLRYGTEKAKRSERLTLMDDGELVDTDEEIEVEPVRQNHRSR